MALTEERIDLPTPSISDVVSEPDEATATPGWAWALVVLGVAMAIVLAVVVLQAADGADTDAGVGDHHLLVENGSPRAIDAASISGPHDHALVVRYGSITAIDHAAEAGLPVPGSATGDDGLAEHGSITAIDHAAEASGS